jgi:hypothetical protein
MDAPDAVVTAWDQAVAHWDDPARHDALLAQVATFSCFAWAAARYRERAGDPVADAALARLRKAATATMLATATVRPDDEKVPYRNAILILIALVILVVVGMMYAKAKEHAVPTRTEQAP